MGEGDAEGALTWKEVLLYAHLANMCGASVEEVRGRTEPKGG